jgi:ABC-type Fe3+-hydroxamate transport system substrate-binding protein
MKRSICLFFVLVLLAGCATMTNLQTSWNKLTPNDKARVVVGGFQDQLNNLFDIGKVYVLANPDKAEQWKTKVIPAFDTANKSLRTYIIMVGMGTATPEMVFKEIPAMITSITDLLKVMGVKVGGVK